MRQLLGALYIVLLSYTHSVYAIDPAQDWYSLETDHFIVHFNKPLEKTAEKAGAIAEKVHAQLVPFVNWEPDQKTHLVISDETDFSNGYATPYTFNRSVLLIAQPDYPNSLEDYDDWLELLIKHEYMHILHLDKSQGIVSGFRKIFGRHTLLFPNYFQPPWMIEGLATEVETDYEKIKDLGTGRGQSSYFEMMMRMEVASGIKPVSQVNLPFRSWPGRSSAYLYGVYFYQFLKEVYGQQTINHLINAYSSHLIPFMINSNAKSIVDKDISELWSEYQEWLENKFRPGTEKVRKNKKAEGIKITEYGYLTDQAKYTNNGDLFYIRNDAFLHASLIKQDKENVQHEVVEVHSNSRMDVHDTAGVLLAQPEFCDNYNLNYDLYIYSFENGEIKRITECGRYRSAVWSPDGEEIIAVQINSGQSELHLLDAKGIKKTVLWKGDDETVLGQPDWSDNGERLVASVFRKAEGWNIEEFDIASRSWRQLTHDKAIDAYPAYINDNEILFSSDRTGVYNIFKLNIKKNNIEQLSNVIGGAFKSSFYKNNIVYIGYTENGYDVFKLENPSTIKHQQLYQQQSDTRDQIAADKFVHGSVRDYSPWSSLQPRWWEPVLFMEEEKSEIGFTTSGHDALAIHHYFIRLANDSKNELITGGLFYGYADRFLMGVNRESSLLSDSFGNYAATIVEDDYAMYWLNPVRRFESVWNVILGAEIAINKEHRREPWVAPINDYKDKLAGLAILYSNSKNYPVSISEADGRRLRLVYENSDVWNSDFTGEVYSLDWREYLKIGQQHVVALRILNAWGTDAPQKFVLGGEDNDYQLFDFLGVESEELFGKRDYALRGYAEGLPQLTGRRMQLASLEWRFPLGLVERGFMAPPIGLIQWSGSVFAETGAAWDMGSSPQTHYSSVGLEIHADVNLFYRINTRVRLGYASGLDEVIGEDRVYFSLGASF